MTEKVALITGAGSGVGRAAALALAGAGFAIVLAGRRREPIEAVAGEVKASGARALVAPADISDPKSVADLFASATAAFGRLDLLFNNAGINTPAAPIEDIPFDQWQAVVATNLTGMFLCTQHAIRIFKAQNPQGGTAISIWAKSDAGKGKVEFLQNDKVVSTMDVDLKAGMNRVQWSMRGPAPPPPAGGGRGGRGGGGGGGEAQQPEHNGPGRAGGVPFVAGGRGGGGGGGGFGFGVQQGPMLEPGTFMIRLTVGTETRMSSVDILEDIWMRPQ